MMKKYHITYFYWIENQCSGFGSEIIIEDDDEDIYTEAELEVIRKHIISKGFDGCVIINIIPLNN